MGRVTGRELAVVSLGAAIGVATPVLGQGNLADLSASHMDVYYARAGTGPFGPRDAKYPLYEKDELKTDPDSWATVQFRSNPKNELRVDRKSHVRVRRGKLKPIARLPGPLRLASRAGEPLRLAEGMAAEAPGPEFNEIEVVQGAVFGDFSTPGILHWQDIVAVVPKGQFEWRAHDESARLRCYSGAVLVGGAGATVRGGVATRGAETMLVDNALQGDPGPWKGGTLILVSGPDAGQSRDVRDFAAGTGTITVDPPLAFSITSGTGYLLTRPGDFTRVPARTEATVHPGGKLSALHRTFPRAFPDGQEDFWADLVPEAGALAVYPGSALHRKHLLEMWPIDDDCKLFGTDTCRQRLAGDLDVTIRSLAQDRSTAPAGGSAGSEAARETTGAALLFLSGAAVRGGTGDGETSPDHSPPGSQTSPPPAGGYSGVTWQVGPYGIGGSEGETLGDRARLDAVSGRLLSNVEGRYQRFRGRDRTDLSEAALLYRFGRGGDLKVGRQHLYFGPVNNSRLGTLMGFNTADAAVWSAPAARRLGWRVGYLRNTAALEGDGFSGWFGRVHGPLAQGLWGVTLLTAHRATGDLGASVDLSVPLARYYLNGYMEAGRDPFERNVLTGGFYFPRLYRRAGVHLFVEYQSRTGFSDRLSLRLNSEVAARWLAVGYLVTELDGRTSGGVGLRYRWQWQ